MAIQGVNKCKYIKCTDNTMCYDDNAIEIKKCNNTKRTDNKKI